jgi:hypothetical protein
MALVLLVLLMLLSALLLAVVGSSLVSLWIPSTTTGAMLCFGLCVECFDVGRRGA